MSWAAIASAIGGAAKTTMLTAPETPKAQKELFLDQEKSRRKREDVEAKEEARRVRLADQRKNDKDYEQRQRQKMFDDFVMGNSGYSTTTPFGVQQMNQFQDRQNAEAGAIGSMKQGGFYRMGVPNRAGGNVT